MVPGFARLGVLVVLFNVLVVAAVYAYLRYRYPVNDRAVRRRVDWGVGGGTALATLGLLAALGAPGSLWLTDELTFEQATTIVDAGAVAALGGYAVVCVGLAIHVRASDRRA